MWGQNGRGTLGLGRGEWVWGDSPGEMAQTDVNLGTGMYVTALAMACYFDGAAGTGHSCAIVSDGQNPGCLKCWGANDKGQVSACCRSAARARTLRLTIKKSSATRTPRTGASAPRRWATTCRAWILVLAGLPRDDSP